MSQINANFQEIISNNNHNNQSNTLDNVTGTAIISSEALQGFSMANQFAICANSGNGPVLLSCLTPMLLPTLTGTSKGNFELTSGDGRGQNQQQTVQIQLASPFNLAGNLCNANNAQSLQSLGLSYINLSSLTNAGTGFPLQITLSNPSNNNGSHQITIPTATLNSLNQEIQIAQNYQISPQVKFEPECNVSTVPQQMQQQQQQNIVATNHTQDISDIDDKVKRKPRRRIPNKSQKSMAMMADNEQPQNNGVMAEERLLDHKGRPFIYNCPNCPKKFTLNSRLTAHLRCHTGIRPYTCVQCGFSFTQKSYLIRHAAVHTEERPFTCERCLKTYKHYGSLANHRKLHRKEDKNGGGCTSDVSDTDQKQPQSGENDPASETTTEVTNNTAVVATNYDNILQLHSDWTAVDNTTTTTTYLITNTNGDNNIVSETNNISAYFATSAATVQESHHVMSGTGPVAFPEQQIPDNNAHNSCLTVSSGTNQSMICVSSNNSRDKSTNQSPVFIDPRHHHHHLQLIQQASSNQNNPIIDSNNASTSNILYTHVELSTAVSDSQSQLSSSSSLSSQSQQQQIYSNI